MTEQLHFPSSLSRRPIIFVGGLHRSGTTMLARLLGRHPECSGFFGTGAKMDEGQWLQEVYPRDVEFGSVGLFAFDERAHLTEACPWARLPEGDRLLSQWARHWVLSKRWLVEKTPGNILMTRFLRTVAPNCWFVFIVRHPVAVALAAQRWAEVSIPVLLEHWFRAHDIMHADLRLLDRWIVVKYEAFVADPQGCFDRICDTIGLDRAPISEPVLGDLNAGYQALWQNGGKGALYHDAAPVSFWLRQQRNFANRKKRWLRRRGFTVASNRKEAAPVEHIFGQRLASAGYRLDDFDAFEGAWSAARVTAAPWEVQVR